jgi:hypothetical protein
MVVIRPVEKDMRFTLRPTASTINKLPFRSTAIPPGVLIFVAVAGPTMFVVCAMPVPATNEIRPVEKSIASALCRL